MIVCGGFEALDSSIGECKILGDSFPALLMAPTDSIMLLITCLSLFVFLSDSPRVELKFKKLLLRVIASVPFSVRM